MLDRFDYKPVSNDLCGKAGSAASVEYQYSTVVDLTGNGLPDIIGFDFVPFQTKGEVYISLNETHKPA